MMKLIKQLRDINGDLFFEVSLHEKGFIYQTWKGRIDDDKVKSGSELSLEVIKETGIPVLLNDNRELSGNWTSSNDWIESNYIPNAYNAGLRFIAHVFSPHFITKFSSIDLETRNLKIPFKTFDKIEEAENWLIQMTADLTEK